LKHFWPREKAKEGAYFCAAKKQKEKSAATVRKTLLATQANETNK